MRRVLLYAVLILIGAAGGYVAGAHQRPQSDVRPVSSTTTATANSILSQSNKGATLDMQIVDGGLYRVRKVIDGDSIILENGVRVCYHGVRAPETGHYVKDPAPLAQEALQRNADLVEGKQIKLTLAKDPFDLHGRILARVTLQGTPAGGELGVNSTPARADVDVGTQLIKEGLARAFGLGLNPDNYRELKHLEDTARQEKIGLWSLEDKVRADSKTGKPYCASSTSSLYHLATCPVAKRIRAENKHEYATMDEAEDAGKNPCRKCVNK